MSQRMKTLLGAARLTEALLSAAADRQHSDPTTPSHLISMCCS